MTSSLYCVIFVIFYVYHSFCIQKIQCNLLEENVNSSHLENDLIEPEEGQIVISDRSPVKLNNKQNLILNQLLAFYAIGHSTNELCRNHTKEFKECVRAFEPWALKMLDSSSKLQSGLLLGNLVEYGSYSQCLKIHTDQTNYGPIWGKHCLIRIKPSDDLILKVLKLNKMEKKERYVEKEMFVLGWSVCVPHSCPANDVLKHFKKAIMEISVGLDMEIDLDENYCRSIFDLPKFKIEQFIVLSIYGFFIIMGLIATILDINNHSESEGLEKFFQLFSTYRNLKKIFTINTYGQYNFLYGLRFVSSCFVVIGHRFIMFIIYPVINGLEELEWPNNYSSLFILGSTVSVDSFFFISGMFVAIGFFEHVHKTGKFHIIGFYLYRYLRITLPLIMVVMFYIWLAQFLADGPFAHYVYTGHQRPCQKYWWSILLHLQSIVNPGELCIFQTWYLSCEMQFYFLSPLLLYPLWKRPLLGYYMLGISYIVFIGISFFLAWNHKYNGTPLPITNQLFDIDFFKEYYVVPHVRAPPYIMGLAFGYLMYKTKFKKPPVIHPGIRQLAYLLAAILLLISAGGCRNFYLENHQYNRFEAAAYLTFSRSGWTIGLMWIIWCCMKGYGGVLNEFLAANIFRMLGKVTYGIFLIHSIIQVYKGGSSKVPSNFTNFNAIFNGLADVFLSIILSVLFTVFFEMPLVHIQTSLFNIKPRRKSKATVSAINTKNGG